MERIYAAHAVMATAVDRAIEQLSPRAASSSGAGGPGGLAVPTAQPGDVFQQATPYGQIRVSGTQDHTYTSEAFVTIDLGGNDRYDHGVATARGEPLDLLGVSPPPSPTSPSFPAWVADVRERLQHSHNVSVAIDVQGQDDYDATSAGAQGVGAWAGFGALADLAGQDSYSAPALAQGTGWVAGAGFLVDGGGDDTYVVTQQGQGYSQDGGAGFLADATGTDLYKAQIVAQGTGFVGGLAGVLVDGTGNDQYSCTGVANFQDVVIPVDLPRPGSTCHAVGFGGDGILVDSAGNDRYETFSSFQAMSLIGTGVLVDGAGDDVYDAGEWSNANGILGVAVIADGGGSDEYASNQTAGPWVDIYVGSNGEGYALGAGVLSDATGHDTYRSKVDKGLLDPQFACGAGCTHDAGIGLLSDGEGDDLYRTEYGEGASVGVHDPPVKNSTGGFAALVDGEGDDTYDLTEGSTSGQGYAELGIPLDSDCSYGLLVDGRGTDSYSNPVTDLGTRADDSYWGQGDYGRGIDGLAGAQGYATGQLTTDLQEIVQRRACETIT